MKTKKDIRKQVYLNKLSHKTVKRGIEHADCEAKKTYYSFKSQIS